jgi:hypothetical protein
MLHPHSVVVQYADGSHDMISEWNTTITPQIIHQLGLLGGDACMVQRTKAHTVYFCLKCDTQKVLIRSLSLVTQVLEIMGRKVFIRYF